MKKVLTGLTACLLTMMFVTATIAADAPAKKECPKSKCTKDGKACGKAKAACKEGCEKKCCTKKCDKK